jgi:Ca2+-binding RTX toxin-like protein
MRREEEMAVFIGTDQRDVIDDLGDGGVSDNPDELYGNAGNDFLKGFGGADLIYGHDGHDFLTGDDGNDLVFAGFGSDRVLGANHDDEIEGQHGDDVIEGGEGNDLLYGDGSALGDTGVDRVEGGAGNDDIYGGPGDETGKIKAANSEGGLTEYKAGLWGGIGDDMVFGDDGQDDLYGDTGNDQLYGGRGIDYLYDGDGKDLLWGGKNPDLFIFSTVEDIDEDEIRDFALKKDGIDLRDIDARESKSGNQKFKFIGKKGFKGKEGELQSKKHEVRGDTDGDGKPDFTILVNVKKLGEDDFFL